MPKRSWSEIRDKPRTDLVWLLRQLSTMTNIYGPDYITLIDGEKVDLSSTLGYAADMLESAPR